MIGFNPTGGLIYHWRAARYGNNLWRPFRSQVAALLQKWSPPEANLIVIGPSGGYSLPTGFLRCFRQVHLVDPDRWARLFFGIQHDRIGGQWHHDNWIFKDGRYQSRLLIEQLELFPNTAVLFANVIGQLPLINDDLEALKNWWTDVRGGLAKRSWFSYHDLYSFTGSYSGPEQLTLDPILPQLQRRLGSRPTSLQLIDHGTAELFTQPMAPWIWQITPQQFHVIGAEAQRLTIAAGDAVAEAVRTGARATLRF